MMKSSGFDDWSQENCFLNNFQRFFNVCSFIKLDGYTNKGQNGKTFSVNRSGDNPVKKSILVLNSLTVRYFNLDCTTAFYNLY